MFFKGAGKVLIATRSAGGVPGMFRYLGNVSDGAKFKLKTDTGEIFESETGANLLALRYEKSKNATVEFDMHNLSKENAAFAMRSVAADITAGTVTAEVLPIGIVVGDIARLVKPKVSSVVVNDSTGTPKTLVAGTNYSVFSADHGSIKFLDLTTGAPYVQPFKVDYSNALANNVPMFTADATEYWVRFELVNSSPDSVGQLGAKVLVEFYRVNFDALKEFLMKGKDPSEFGVEGAVMYDDTKALDPALGQFGRLVML